jgi:hypothetical protein
MMFANPRRSANEVASALIVWLCVALAVGAGGWFRSVTAPRIAATVWTLTAIALLCCWRIGRIRNWAMHVDVRWLVLLHVSRFVGFYFFWLYQRDELPFAFAVPAGWGDNLVAALALVLLALPQMRNWKVLLLIWNTIGLIDIIFVAVLALRIGLADWQSMHALREWPLSLLPTFFVPLIITSHVLIFVRAARASV